MILAFRKKQIASWNNIVSCNIVKLFSSKMITLVLNTVSF